MSTRRRSWGPRVVVLSVLAAALPAAPTGATTADEVCAPAVDPCVVTAQVRVTDASLLDFGTRRLVIARGAVLDAGSGTMTIVAGEITVEADATVRAIGPSGGIDISAGTIAIVGAVSADGNGGGGNVVITATASFLNEGVISANGRGSTGIGGNVELMGGTLTLAGDVEARAAGDNLGGCVTVSADADIDLAGSISVAGGDGGDILVAAGLIGGNLRIDAEALLDANGSGTSGGSGGGIELTAAGDGLTHGHVDLAGTLRARAGTLQSGDGGCITVSAAGNLVAEDPDAEISVNSGTPDGFAGEISIVATGGVALKSTLSAQGSGSEGVGGDIEVLAGGDLLIDEPARIRVTGPGDGGFIDLLSDSGEVWIRSRTVDASGTLGADGGDVRIRASGMDGRIVVVGTVSANGTAAGRGGAIEATAGNRLDLLGPATVMGSQLQAQGGSGGTITLRTLRGPLMADGRVSALGSLALGGTISVGSGGDLAITGNFQAVGNSQGGTLDVEANGPITVDGLLDTSADGNGGMIDVVGAGAITVSGEVDADGGVLAASQGGQVLLHGCDVDLVDEGLLTARGTSGVNRITGRRAIRVGGRLMADPTSGRNELVYRDTTNPPIVLATATVTPAAMRILDPTLQACAVCGDTFIEPPETCDDGNQDGGDGCSSTCQIEAVACDADGDGDIDELDVAGLESELFDGDGDRTLDVGGGAFPGTIGSDGNDDGRISSPDLSRCIEALHNQ